ncbi:hypothetical protein TSUD_418140, partial [Trifolium subterraneum]
LNVDKIPRRAKGKNVVVAGSAQAQEQEPDDENEEQMEVETEPGLEEQEDEDDLSDFFDFGDEEDEEEQEQEQQVEAQAEPQPPPPQKKERKKNTRTTQGRNPPRAGEGKVSSYPSGPTDLSLLPGFGKHVAASLWRGELKTNYNNLDWGLLTAFTERWQPETGTFHLPIGEVTITLDDVSCLLHIPITGKMLGTSCTTEEGEDMCREYLNFPRAKCRAEFKKMKGAHIGFPMLEKIYAANLRRAHFCST